MRPSTKTLFSCLAFFFSATLLSGCSHVFYQPDRHIYFPPEKFKLTKQDIHLETKDGVKLMAWYFPHTTKTCKGTVIQFHGNGENISSHYASLVWLVNEGYSLFTFDYRSYGGSEGEPNQANVNDDAHLALDRALELKTKNHCGKFIVYGQSLGGVISMRALADWDKTSHVDHIVMDSTFMSYKRVARQAMSHFWLTWPFSPLAWILVSDEYASDKVIDQIHRPLLVIHDRQDPTIAFSNGEEIHAKYQGPKEFWDFKAGTHISYFAVPGFGAHRKKFIDYLSK